jgi:hypothetical protein
MICLRLGLDREAARLGGARMRGPVDEDANSGNSEPLPLSAARTTDPPLPATFVDVSSFTVGSSATIILRTGLICGDGIPIDLFGKTVGDRALGVFGVDKDAALSVSLDKRGVLEGDFSTPLCVGRTGCADPKLVTRGIFQDFIGRTQHKSGRVGR